MELDMIKMIVVVLATFVTTVNAAPINSTTSSYSYCNETSGTSSGDLLQILYDDLDNTLDVLGEVCLSYDEIVRCYVAISDHQ